MDSSASSASQPSTKPSAQQFTKSNTPVTPSESSPFLELKHLLLDEKKDLLAQLAPLENQGYTARLAKGFETPSQNLYFTHESVSEEEDDILNDMIVENYELRIRYA
jgi:hypothetical protein